MLATNTSAVDVEDFHEDLVIDEVSPSEDERFAESVIRGHSAPDEHPNPAGLASQHALVSAATQRDAEDVVAQYRQRNHAPRLPENAQLFAVRRQQTSPNSQSLLSAGEVNREGSVANNLDIADLLQATRCGFGHVKCPS
ncbi:hypothetical protein SCLCIDRAFT_24737 [Scleroderma citrinum Foug A]|uniref:Uncharacterized protein n=1 Tax=Scleroderma citrinum Foug A TaxID=1036808 RepID=A0A0C3ADD1_9AGAM|nr:hypothetical protein SCLCIDRAFT_24737 [Scleroderma citrinum Foug A]